MADVKNFLNPQGSWSNTVAYSAKIISAQTFDGPISVSCPAVDYTDGKVYYYPLLTPSTAGVTPPTSGSGWVAFAATATSGSGTVTSFAATDGGGFDFTVTNPTTTPTLTAKPSFTGFAYSDGTSFQAAGTDGTGTNLGLTGAAGTWTPTLTCTTPGDLAILYTTQTGSFVRIGNIIIATFNIVASNFTFSTATGNVIIGGTTSLPGSPTFPLTAFGTISIGNYTKAGYVPGSTILNSSGLQIIMNGSGNASVNMEITDLTPPDLPSIQGTIVYALS